MKKNELKELIQKEIDDWQTENNYCFRDWEEEFIERIVIRVLDKILPPTKKKGAEVVENEGVIDLKYSLMIIGA